MYYAEKSRKLEVSAEGYDEALKLATIFNILSFLLNLFNMVVFFMQTQTLGKEALTRIWSITDFCIIICNVTVFSKVFFKDKDIDFLSFIRIIEAILIILIWFKSLYFMRLVGAIAPLVDSIFVIMKEMLYFLFIFVIGMVAIS